MVLELNASDERGINVVRDQIKNFASTQNFFQKGVKLVILDEADSMTNPAQMALRRIMEQYTKYTRFCLICNQVSRIIPALQSRCARFRFETLPIEASMQRVDFIIQSENMMIENDAKEALIKLAKGDIRRVVNILQTSHMIIGEEQVISEYNIHQITGTPTKQHLHKIFEILLNDILLESINKIYFIIKENSLALVDIITGIYPIVMELDVDEKIKRYLATQMCEAEYNLCKGCSDEIQLGFFVSAFVKIRTM